MNQSYHSPFRAGRFENAAMAKYLCVVFGCVRIPIRRLPKNYTARNKLIRWDRNSVYLVDSIFNGFDLHRLAQPSYSQSPRHLTTCSPPPGLPFRTHFSPKSYRWLPSFLDGKFYYLIGSIAWNKSQLSLQYGGKSIEMTEKSGMHSLGQQQRTHDAQILSTILPNISDHWSYLKCIGFTPISCWQLLPINMRQ